MIKLPKALSIGEETLAQHLNVERVKFEREVKFHPNRKWQFDFVIRSLRRNIAVEVEGGTFAKSRHTSAKGYAADCEKYNEASLMGWVVLRFTTQHVKELYAIETIMRAIK